MPLNLHKDCRDRLNEAVAEGLEAIETSNGMFIERRATVKLAVCDFILPSTGKLHNQLVEILGEFPLTEFVTETLSLELWELDRYINENPKLIEIAEYSDTKATAVRILDQFETLPWSYRITIPLPETLDKILNSELDTFQLSSTIRVIRATAEFANEFPLETDNKRRNRRMNDGGTSLLSDFLTANPPKWDSDRIYLQISVEGFIDQYGSTPTAYAAERTFRSFCGVGIANRLFEYKYKYSPTGYKTRAYVHRQRSDGTWEPITRYDIDDSVARGLAGLKLCDLNGYLKTEESKASWAFYRMGDIGTVFRAGAQADAVTLAAQWLFDSYAGQDQLLSFVQSMVAMEIVLGDKSISDEIGVGELISNRLAYLIGSTLEERSELLSSFKQIYRVRSQIVHSGKHRLTLSEQSMFSRLRWMCRRVIDKEVDLLKAAIEKEKPLLEKK